MKTMLLAALVVAIAAPASAATNLVTNPGFETGNLSGWTGPTGNGGFSSISGASHTGAYAYRNGAIGSFGTISQMLATVAGRTYEYSFWLTNEGNPINAFQAVFGGSTLVSFTNSDPFGWTQYTGMHTATANGETLSFSFRQDPSFFRLDDVSVAAAVPEPATWSMLIVGFALVGAASRRRNTAIAA